MGDHEIGSGPGFICIYTLNCVYMGSKNISLRNDVYEALRAVKAEDESFSDVIDRLLTARNKDHPLYSIVGILDEEQADRVRERANAHRESVDSRMGPE